MSLYWILIVEDEVLIVDIIECYLLKEGYIVIGKAIFYEEVIEVFQEQELDLVLLDIWFNGSKIGIVVVWWLIEQ